MSGSSSVPVLTSFTSGDIVISVVGNGDGKGTNGDGTGLYGDNAASPIVLEEIDPTTGSIVGAMTLPQQTTTLANGTVEYGISGEYGSSSEGSLQLSGDGQSLVIAGYGVNAATYNAGGAAVYGNAAEAQSTSVPGGQYTPVARVIADISFNGTVDTSTALYNVFNTNNPRSVATYNGSTFYISGQGVSGDKTQGVFVANDGANSATAIDNSSDTRTVEIYNGQLVVSRDSKQVGGGEITTYGATTPTSAATPTQLPGIGASVTLTAGQANGINNAEIGMTVYLSPENFYFANATTLYIADGGIPKEGGLGDGGLQKWTYNTSTSQWTLDYTLSDGLNLVANTATAGTSGLIGLTGTVLANGTVMLYTTNETIGDLDQKYLFDIADTLSATTLPMDEVFNTLVTAAPDTNIRGVAFAPTASALAPTNITIASGTSVSGITVTSGGTLSVLAGGTAVGATVLSGGTASIYGQDKGSYIAEGGFETVIGTASLDTIYGTQLVSATGASIVNETVFNGGAIELFLKGETASSTSIESGGKLLINGNATANNITINGGEIILESPKAVLTGMIDFSGTSSLVTTAIISASYGDFATLVGFAAGDVIDLTGITSSSATLALSVVNGNTIADISNGTIHQFFTFASIPSGDSFALTTDGANGVDLILLPPPVGASGTISSGQTGTNLTVTSGGSLTVLGGGTAVNASILSGGTELVAGIDSGSTIFAGGFQNVSATTYNDQVYGQQLVSAASGVVNNDTVFNGGTIELYLKGAIANNPTLNGGDLFINGNATAANAVILNGGTLELQSPKSNVTGTLTFQGAGTIDIVSPISAGSGNAETISGFGAGDVILISGFGAGTTFSQSYANGTTIETVTSGTGSESQQSFTFAGSLAPDFFLDFTNNGIAEITAAPCFAAGTRILTPAGEVQVQDLKIGDLVITREGEDKPIIWIGRRMLNLRQHPRPEAVQPIRIDAGAFDDASPSRDLLLSPDHALYLDGYLVPAKALVNGANIVQLNRASVTYYHIELASHEVIFADGTMAETYLETGNRGNFDNGGPAVTLHPDFAQTLREAEGLAPFAETGPVVESFKTRAASRFRRARQSGTR